MLTESLTRKVGLIVSVAPLTLAVSAATAAATEKSPTQDNDTIMVVGNWLDDADPELVKAHAGARHVVREEQIEESGANTVAEALRLLPGVQVPENNGTGSGDFALNIGLRGLGSRLTSRATVLLDGVPLANAPYGQPQLSMAPISLGNIKAIDVVKGGSAVRYGPQNIGGVVNFITPAIPDDVAGRLALRSEMSTSDGEESRLNGSFSIGGTAENGAGALLSYSGDHGDGFRENNDQDIDNLLLKYTVPVGDTSRIEGRINLYEAEAILPGPLSSAEFDADPFQSTHSFERFDGDRQEVTARYVNEIDALSDLEVGVFASDSFREFTLANGNDSSLTRLDRLPREYQVFGIEPRFSRVSVVGDNTHEWSVGYRYIREESNEKRYRRSGAAGFDPTSVAEVLNRNTDGETDAHALYIDDRITLGNLELVPGLRYENISVSRTNLLTNFTDDEDYSELLPSVSASYSLSPSTLLYANANRSFAAVGHLALSTASDSSLEPERSDLYEIGARYESGPLGLDSTLFYIDFDNQIQYDASVGANVNIGSTRHRGLELALSYDLSELVLAGLSVDGSYAYTQAKHTSGENSGNDLRLYSRHTGSVGLNYRQTDWRMNLRGFAQSSQFADDANTVAASADGANGKIPGFSRWNLSAQRDLTLAGLDTQISFGIKNLFDKRYFTRASIENNGGLYVGEPRTAYIEVATTF
ncbi:TonB-dependent siderophore receptor [Pontibacterium granulatum]|uniref:TonB-dependent receptor family protein n=1 Tax=Pontibacterium granulatum TaxID=2036029 RepID=UPI00249BF53B|nr:TonB-dependent siderophore receptor [Pontibacterium granulatum]MDI3324544.1 TonB-dependent siderophore receptor [Pontibacterium granulatum]